MEETGLVVHTEGRDEIHFTLVPLNILNELRETESKPLSTRDIDIILEKFYKSVIKDEFTMTGSSIPNIFNNTKETNSAKEIYHSTILGC